MNAEFTVRLQAHPLTGEANVDVTPTEALELMVGHAKHDKEWADAHPDRVRYIGRQRNRHGNADFGNPFSHLPRSTAPFKVASQLEAVEKYAAWLADAGQAALRERIVAELRGKVLLCHCRRMGDRDTPCHGQVLVRMANEGLAAKEGEPELLKTAKLNFDARSQFEAFVRELKLDESPKVLVCGDRNWSDRKVVVEQLQHLGPAAVIIEGEARGADELARNAALRLGFPVAGFPAKWDPTPNTPKRLVKTRIDGKLYVPSAGIRRNELMLDCKPDLVVAFHDRIERSRGTRHTVETALNRGIPTKVFTSSGKVLEGDELVQALAGAGVTPEPGP